MLKWEEKENNFNNDYEWQKNNSASVCYLANRKGKS